MRVDAWCVKNGFVISSKFAKNAVPFEMHTVGRRLTVALILKFPGLSHTVRSKTLVTRIDKCGEPALLGVGIFSVYVSVNDSQHGSPPGAD